MHEIHYADDDIDDIDIFTEAVKVVRERNSVNIDLFVYNTGENLLKAVRERKLVKGPLFLDINMPGKTGFQLLHEIKSNPNYSSIPIIMYSTSTDVNVIKKSQSLGANLYAVKPNTFNEMNDI